MKQEMEELREIAESYYEAGSGEVQAKAQDFFKSMDVDGNGKVNLEEFLTFMRHEGYKEIRNNSFFKMLDATGHGTLAFMDVMTLYYIIKSGRPFCDCCGKFIPGAFFSCLICFNHSETSFNICCDCHKFKNSQHKHDGSRALFLDNYTLLHATKRHSPTTTNQLVADTPAEPTHGQTLLLLSNCEHPPHSSETVHLPPSKIISSTTDHTKKISSEQLATDHTEKISSEQLATDHTKKIRSEQLATDHTKKIGSEQLATDHTKKIGSEQLARTKITSSATEYMNNEFNKKIMQLQVQSQTSSREPSPVVKEAKNVATTSAPNTQIANPPSPHPIPDTPQNAIIPAPRPKLPWMSIASASLKALDALMIISNAVTTASGCTIM